jgi:hypothetical protein
MITVSLMVVEILIRGRPGLKIIQHRIVRSNEPLVEYFI